MAIAVDMKLVVMVVAPPPMALIILMLMRRAMPTLQSSGVGGVAVVVVDDDVDVAAPVTSADGPFCADLLAKRLRLRLGGGRRRVCPPGQQHVREDLAFIPSFSDWMKAIRSEPWMGRALHR